MSNETTIMPGAEAYSWRRATAGAPLIIHGFTGCPQSMRPLAEAFAAAGLSVELPRLPGRGTTPEDMAKYQSARLDRRGRHRLSGISVRARTKLSSLASRWAARLTLWTAEQHPEVAAIVVINGACEDEDIKGLVEAAEQALASSQTFTRGGWRRRRSKLEGARLRPRSRRHGRATHGRCGGSEVEAWRNQMSGADPAQSARPCRRPRFGQGHARRDQSADRILGPRKELSRGNDRL